MGAIFGGGNRGRRSGPRSRNRAVVDKIWAGAWAFRRFIVSPAVERRAEWLSAAVRQRGKTCFDH
jgi:hypothetical protein